MVDAVLNLLDYHLRRRSRLRGCIPPSGDIPMKISERDAEIASSNIDPGHEPIFFGKAPRPRSLITGAVPNQRLCTSLPFHGTSGIFTRMSFHFGSWFKED
jgi:hypothetical protein